jgi:hypothetical protein
VTLQPAGPTISLLELSPVLTMRNSPLVMGVARQMMKLQSVSTPDGAAAVPYILFVVRPDGIRPYYEARARLEMLGLSFGYELVAQDEEIEFPDLTDASEWTETPSARHHVVNPEDVWPSKPPSSGPGGHGDANDFVWKSKGSGSGSEPANGPGALAGGPELDTLGTDPTNGATGSPLAQSERPSGLGAPGSRGGGFGGGSRAVPMGPANLIDPTDPARGSSHIGTGGAAGLEEPGPFHPPAPRGAGSAGTDIAPAGNAGGSGSLVAGGLDDGNRGTSGGSRGPSGASEDTPPLGGGPRGEFSGGTDLPRGTLGTRMGTANVTVSDGSSPGKPSNATDPSVGGLGSSSLRPGSSRSNGTTADSPPSGMGRGIGGRPDLSSRFAPATNATPGSTDTLGDWPSGNAPRQSNSAAQSRSAAGGSRSSQNAVASGTVLGRSDNSGTTPDPGMIGIGNVTGAGTSTTASSSNTDGGNGSGSTRQSSSTSNNPTSGDSSAAGSSTGTSNSSGMPSLGMPGQAQDPTARNYDARVVYRKQRNLEVVVTCDSKGVHIQPGGYRLTISHLDPKEGRFLETLRAVVAQREATDRNANWKPRVKFLVEPGGEDVYWKARRQTILAGLGWPIELQVAERDPIRLLSTEEAR